MDILHKIEDCKSSKELDSLREEIRLAASYGEIPDYQYMKRVFMEKKSQLEAKENGN